MKALIVMALFTLPLVAQQPPKPLPAPAPAAAPQLTFADKIAIDALTKQEQAQQQDLNRTYQQEQQLVSEINAAHPGYTFSPQTGTLVPKPLPEIKPVKPADIPKQAEGAGQLPNAKGRCPKGTEKIGGANGQTACEAIPKTQKHTNKHARA